MTPITELTMARRKQLADNLRQRRLALPKWKARNRVVYPVSQQTLAKRIGVSPRQYSNWEQANESVTLDLLWKVADYYKVSVGALCR